MATSCTTGAVPHAIGRSSQRGMSIVEAMIAMAVVAVALLALLSLITSASKVQDDSRERTLAYNAARKLIEEMRSDTFEQIYTKYKVGGTIGNAFRVDNIPAGTGVLKSSPSDPTAPQVNSQGLIIFPEATAGGGVTEDPSDAILSKQFGMPKDLNQDGDTNDTDLISPSILPVKIQVQWRNANGRMSQVEVITFITGK